MTRARGLCHRCYFTPAIQALYPPMPPAESGRLGGSKNKGAARTRAHRRKLRAAALAWAAARA